MKSLILLFLGLLLGVVSGAQGATVTLAWDASPSQGVEGYRIYQGTSPGNYPIRTAVGKVLTTSITGITDSMPTV